MIGIRDPERGELYEKAFIQILANGHVCEGTDGNPSIKITVDTYGHLMPGGNKAAVDRLDRLETVTIRNPAATASGNPVFRQTGST